MEEFHEYSKIRACVRTTFPHGSNDYAPHNRRAVPATPMFLHSTTVNGQPELPVKKQYRIGFLGRHRKSRVMCQENISPSYTKK
jgi:hypothetical protein